MKFWEHSGFDTEYPRPEDGWAFVLGGTLEGEIVQSRDHSGQTMPYFRKAVARNQDVITEASIGEERLVSYQEESYRLEYFSCGEERRLLRFYVLEGDKTADALIRSFFSMCMFKREARKNH
jgi:hypothetical protein